MGANESVQPGRDAGVRREPTAGASTRACGFCGQRLVTRENDSTPTEEFVEHVIPDGTGTSTRRVSYCSPSCFIRDMQAVAGIGHADAD